MREAGVNYRLAQVYIVSRIFQPRSLPSLRNKLGGYWSWLCRLICVWLVVESGRMLLNDSAFIRRLLSSRNTLLWVTFDRLSPFANGVIFTSPPHADLNLTIGDNLIRDTPREFLSHICSSFANWMYTFRYALFRHVLGQIRPLRLSGCSRLENQFIQDPGTSKRFNNNNDDAVTVNMMFEVFVGLKFSDMNSPTALLLLEIWRNLFCVNN